MPPKNFAKVIQIIHTRIPHLAQAGSDDIDIINALDNATLGVLDRYVKTCLTKLKKKQAAEISSQHHQEYSKREADKRTARQVTRCQWSTIPQKGAR